VKAALYVRYSSALQSADSIEHQFRVSARLSIPAAQLVWQAIADLLLSYRVRVKDPRWAV
jgi:hypothetical protein